MSHRHKTAKRRPVNPEIVDLSDDDEVIKQPKPKKTDLRLFFKTKDSVKHQQSSKASEVSAYAKKSKTKQKTQTRQVFDNITPLFNGKQKATESRNSRQKKNERTHPGHEDTSTKKENQIDLVRYSKLYSENTDHAPFIRHEFYLDCSPLITDDYSPLRFRDLTNCYLKHDWHWVDMQMTRASTLSAIQLNTLQRPKQLPDEVNRTWIERLDPIRYEFWHDDANIQNFDKHIKHWRRRLEKRCLSPEPKKKKPKKPLKNKRRKILSSDEEDDDYSLESDRHQLPSPPNPFIVWGPFQDKERFVNSVALSNGFKVIEMHAGEKRDGDSLRRKISEASKSQRINVGGIASFFSATERKEERTDATHTLVLISDVDVIFAADRDFVPALVTIIQESLVPIVLTAKNHHLLNALSELPNISYVHVPQPLNLPLLVHTATKEFAGKCMSDDDVNHICQFFNNDYSAIINWLQATCTLDGIVELPVDDRPVYDDRFDRHIIGVEAQGRFQQVYLDAEEQLREHRQNFADVLEHYLVFDKYQRQSALNGLRQSLQNTSSAKALCADLAPVLDLINVIHIGNSSTVGRRRALHYFDKVGADTPPIDRDGHLRTHLSNLHSRVKDNL